MKVYKTKWFARFARQQRISDYDLVDAIERAERGLIDADLGGGLLKLRLGRPGQGRSGGYRLIIAFRTQSVAFFVFGFAKNELENIGHDELLTLRQIATDLLNAGPKRIATAIADNEIQEIRYEEKT